MTTDPEVPEKKPRRKFTAQYKLAILEKAENALSLTNFASFYARRGWIHQT
jgi:hypothetical protein